MFWVGGGLDQCRAALTAAMGVEQTGGALVPATPEVLLRLILTLEEPEVEPVLITKIKKEKRSSGEEESPERGRNFPWRAVAITSLVWLVVITGISSYSMIQLQQQSALIRQLVRGSK